ncbi:TetR family transcriptional regulator, partial [Pseudomonas aeruginosa]|uniref:TetR family transcriptional regulator n=1 Tax=Pseudomonas aeruginosa TaxID=287 RepID=UPI0031B6C6B8
CEKEPSRGNTSVSGADAGIQRWKPTYHDAKLAASVGVSEAALYRHFPSKTRMFDSLIEFIEDSLITRINLILKDEKDTTARLRLIVLLLLGFGERN